MCERAPVRSQKFHIARIIRDLVTLNYASGEKRFEDARKNV